MTVEQLLEDVLRREGGYVNHVADKGGPTNFGITQATLSDYLDRPVSVDEVKGMDRELAKDIYKDRYYRGPKVDTLPDLVRPFLFDAAVNHGPKRAIRMLQDTLNLSGYSVDVDGVVGPGTRAACIEACASMGHYFVNALTEMREHVYRDIVARNPSQKVFLRGWLRRAREFRIDGTD